MNDTKLKEEKKLKLDLGGMTCATCALKIKKQLNKQPGKLDTFPLHYMTI